VSSWWAGCKSGRYPKPYKLGPRTTAWRVDDIRALLEQMAEESPGVGDAARQPCHRGHDADYGDVRNNGDLGDGGDHDE
jgi:hypothetical protein